MTAHMKQYGSGCLVCHDGVDRLSDFQHANFFPLAGKHAEIQCSDCHANQIYRGTPSLCWQCHKEPDIHIGIFGVECDYCHDDQAWSPATLLKHAFPLNHGLDGKDVQQACTTCHASGYVNYTCYSCHDHQQAEMEKSHLEEGIPTQDIPACINCHPGGTMKNDE